MSLQTLLTDSFKFFWNRLFSILLIIVPVVFPIELFRVRYAESFLGPESDFSSQLTTLLLGFAAYPIHAAGVIFFIASVLSGDKLTIRDCWLLGLRFWGPFLLLSLLLGGATALGFMLFLVPGLIVLGRFAFADFDLLLNKHNPADAMRYSWEATRPYFWLILSGYLVIFAAVMAPYFFLVFVLQDLVQDLGIFEVVLDTLYAVLSTLLTIFRFRVYDLANERRNLGLRPTDDDETSQRELDET
jgi:hypothetical protein